MAVYNSNELYPRWWRRTLTCYIPWYGSSHQPCISLFMPPFLGKVLQFSVLLLFIFLLQIKALLFLLPSLGLYPIFREGPHVYSAIALILTPQRFPVPAPPHGDPSRLASTKQSQRLHTSSLGLWFSAFHQPCIPARWARLKLDYAPGSGLYLTKVLKFLKLCLLSPY